MQINHLPIEIQSVSFKDMIWTMVIDESSHQLIIELRNEPDRVVSLVSLDPDKKEAENLRATLNWWDKLVMANCNEITLISYNDQHNPSDYEFYSIHRASGERTLLDRVPDIQTSAIVPQLYENGTPYHQTVSEFMSLELPLACEYLELDEYIIISYYLRSENSFDRFLLCMKDGEKVWKVKQDVGMKGFSPGAFFVLNQQLIFVRERNEVCFYPM